MLNSQLKEKRMSKSKSSTPMTQAAASRIQSNTAKTTGTVAKGSFAARATSAAAKSGKK
jgi:hypothetical protein